MKFSKVCDYKGEAHYVCKTGRKNIRILLLGLPYERSFVVPLKMVSGRRPAEMQEDPEAGLDLNEFIDEEVHEELVPQ
jgi:hypothetical protein